MCELFAVNSLHPVGVRYSLAEFARHGGLTHTNSSGWGISFERGHDSLLVKEPQPAFDSPWVSFIAGQHIHSNCMIAHIRRASIGKASFENSHPFRRELGGQTHVFAHNGDLPGFSDVLPLASKRFLPMGQTDSEHCFCFLLGQLAPLWDAGTPSVADRLAIISGVASAMRGLGPANFLYFDSEVLFVHADRRHFEEDGESAAARPPGLQWLEKQDLHIPGLKISPHKLATRPSLLVASVPLSNDDWHAFERGTTAAIFNGEILALHKD